MIGYLLRDLLYGAERLADALDEWLRGQEADHFLKKQREVPDVVGLPYREAMTSLLIAGFRPRPWRLEPNPEPDTGLVVRQDPPPGTLAIRGTKVVLSVLHLPNTRPRSPAPTA